MAKSKGETKGPTKTKMVEDALKSLGADAGPKEMQGYIKQQFGTEIGTTMISSYKSNILRKRGGGGRGGADGNVSVRDVALIRDLLDRIGSGQLQALIKAMGK